VDVHGLYHTSAKVLYVNESYSCKEIVSLYSEYICMYVDMLLLCA
jgi:hypothetical protein